MSERAPSASALLDAYELLRESALTGDSSIAVGCGLSVILSQGMTAWMKLFQLTGALQQPKRREPVLCSPSVDLADRIAGVLADIFLRQMEESRC